MLFQSRPTAGKKKPPQAPASQTPTAPLAPAHAATMKLHTQKPPTYSASVSLHPAPERKRAPKVKIKLGAISGTNPMAQSRWATADDEDPKSTTVVVSMKDDFMLKQDMCVSCGSFGVDKEGGLIVCVQCGQCYHPYCADVKVSVVDRWLKCIRACTVNGSALLSFDVFNYLHVFRLF